MTSRTSAASTSLTSTETTSCPSCTIGTMRSVSAANATAAAAIRPTALTRPTRTRWRFIEAPSKSNHQRHVGAPERQSLGSKTERIFLPGKAAEVANIPAEPGSIRQRPADPAPEVERRTRHVGSHCLVERVDCPRPHHARSADEVRPKRVLGRGSRQPDDHVARQRRHAAARNEPGLALLKKSGRVRKFTFYAEHVAEQ